jgi:hypothetical protein
MKPPNYRDVERQASRMHDMMDKLDVDRAALAEFDQGQIYADARKRCLCCSATLECLYWLDAPDKARKSPEFCPNLRIFEPLRRRESE